MGRVSKKGTIAGLAAAGVLGVGMIAVPAIAFAENSEPSPSASASASPDAGKKTWEQRREEHKNALAEALAAELGVDKERVAEALDKVHEKLRADARERIAERRHANSEQWAAERKARLSERLDKAVEDGKLTREQADAILKAVEAGVLPGALPGRGWGGHGPR